MLEYLSIRDRIILSNCSTACLSWALFTYALTSEVDNNTSLFLEFSQFDGHIRRRVQGIYTATDFPRLYYYSAIIRFLTLRSQPHPSGWPSPFQQSSLPLIVTKSTDSISSQFLEGFLTVSQGCVVNFFAWQTTSPRDMGIPCDVWGISIFHFCSDLSIKVLPSKPIVTHLHSHVSIVEIQFGDMLQNSQGPLIDQHLIVVIASQEEPKKHCFFFHCTVRVI